MNDHETVVVFGIGLIIAGCSAWGLPATLIAAGAILILVALAR